MTVRVGPVASVYLDACLFIYLVEGAPEWKALVAERLSLLPQTARLFTSQLSRLECRALPIRREDSVLLSRYDALFAANRVVVLDITLQVIDRATTLQAQHRLKAPDAIHLATAIEAGADVFITGDSDFPRSGGISVEVLAPNRT